jgi:hypothetical protein
MEHVLQRGQAWADDARTWGARTGAGGRSTESKRTGAIRVLGWRGPSRPRSRMLSASSPRHLMGAAGGQRRRTTWRRRCPRVVWPIRRRALTWGVVAKTHRKGKAHCCLVQGALTTASTIQRSPGRLTERA